MVQVAARIDTVKILDSIFVELRVLGNNSFTQGSTEEGVINNTVNGSLYRDNYTDFEFDDKCEKDFIVNKKTGEVTTKKALDREKKHEYDCQVKAKRIGEAILRDLGDMKITVLDVNDNPPVFTQEYYQGIIEENSPKNTKVKLQHPIASTDKDVSPNNNVSYTKIKGSNKFQIQQLVDSREIEIWCSEELDREAEAWYYLSIEATDGVNTTTAGLNITVLDVNEPPQFTKTFYEFNVTEGERDIFVGDVSAIDSDADEKGDVVYSIKNGAFDSFHIENNGSLYFKGRRGNLALNIINRRSYDLTITATDREGSTSQADAMVRVTVLDQNEVPVFEKSSYSFSVFEGTSCLTNIGVMNATDNDDGMNAVLEYFLEGDGASMFEIGTDSGIITCKNELDYEHMTSRSTTFGVRVSDKGYPSLTASTTVTVKVEDVNDNSPTLSATYTTDVFDADIKKPGKPIIVIDALDHDSGKNGEVTFDIINSSAVGLFNISSFGLVRVATNIVEPIAPLYNLRINCSDLGIPPLNTTTYLTISVKSVTTQTVSFDAIDLHFNLEEEQAYQNTTVAIGSVERFVINNNSDITFKLVGEPILGINMSDNGTLMAYNKHFDREKRDLYEIITRVYDRTDWKNSDVAVINLKIIDINDHPPVFINNEAEATVDIYENSDNDTHVITVPAIDLDTGNNSIIVYRILNPGVPFSVNSSSGRLVSSGTIDRERNGTVISNYTVIIEASDGKYNDNLTVTIFVKDRNDNSPQFHNISVNVSERFTVNKTILTIDAIDVDDYQSGNGRVLFKLDDGQQSCPISLSAGKHLAEVLLSSKLDYERTISHMCTIIAYDNPCNASESRSTTATLTINVLDENDNIPVFQHFINQTDIDIDVATGTVIIDKITASDDDSGSNGDVNFYIKDHTVKPFDKFRINSTTGRITAVGNYLAEDITVVYLVVIARDSGQPPLETEATIRVSINNSDSRPIFKDIFQIYIVEHQEASEVYSKLTTIVAFDKKYGAEKLCVCSFNIASSKHQSLFSIGSISGVIKLKKELDREVVGSKFNLMIEAIDDDQPKRTSTATVTVNVVDINDNPPTCNNNTEFAINQSSPIGSMVGEIEAQDLDEGVNAVLNYSLYEHNDYFDVDTTSGTVKLVNSIVPSKMKQIFQMTVNVSDGKTPEMCPFRVHVLPDNTSPPKFTSGEYKATISINGKKGDNLEMSVEINATDKDNDTITYSIDPSKNQNMVTIDPNSGIISLNTDIDINTRDVTLVIMAVDDGTPRKTGSSSVVITVTGGFYVAQGKYDNIKRDAEKMTLFQILFIVMLVALCIFIVLTVVACYKWRVSHSLSDSLRTRYYTGANSKWDDFTSGHQYAGPSSSAEEFPSTSTGTDVGLHVNKAYHSSGTLRKDNTYQTEVPDYE
ncbi:cadherin-23 [Patella vulgata]|uniref:cadherin-23 n=1 Tax=Patella vulgata TaxID=6465 RepID=UPI0024A971FA|nr:cadherin-23 [Patella vulgata]